MGHPRTEFSSTPDKNSLKFLNILIKSYLRKIKNKIIEKNIQQMEIKVRLALLNVVLPNTGHPMNLWISHRIKALSPHLFPSKEAGVFTII